MVQYMYKILGGNVCRKQFLTQELTDGNICWATNVSIDIPLTEGGYSVFIPTKGFITKENGTFMFVPIDGSNICWVGAVLAENLKFALNSEDCMSLYNEMVDKAIETVKKSQTYVEGKVHIIPSKYRSDSTVYKIKLDGGMEIAQLEKYE